MNGLQFDSNAKVCSAKNAYSLALASQLAYNTNANEVKTIVTQNWQLSRFRFLYQSETECLVMGDDEKLIVAFRGTETDELEDIKTDLKIRMTENYLEGKVHRGFKEALEAVWGELITALRELQDRNQPLWITGHSLGGALANLAGAKFLAEDDFTIAGLYTFGQPKIGDRNFALDFDTRFKDKMFRFVNNNDAITRLPLRSMGYHHMGTLKYIDTRSQIKDKIPFWKLLLNRFWGRVEDLGKPGTDGVKDHELERYLHSLQVNLD